MKKLLILSLIVLTLWVPAYRFAAAQDGGWHVESATPLSDIVEGLPHYAFPSPDGRQLVREKRGDGDSRTNMICALDIHTGDERCTDLPRPINLRPNDYFRSGSWSLDSTRYALVGLPYHYFRDTDLSIVDLSLPSRFSSLIVLSDDGFEGSWLPFEDATGAYVEIQPAWSPDGTLIAVERTRIGDDDFEPATITLFDLETGGVRDLIALPGHKPDEDDAGSVYGMDWSPDGSTLAISLRHSQADPISDDGIWLVDLETGEQEHLVTVADAENALRSIFPEGPLWVAAPVSWSPDGTRLLFWAGYLESGFVWCFWIDLDTREITAVPLPSHPDDQDNQRMIWPYQAVWSPDGGILLVAARQITPHPDEPLISLDPDAEETERMALYMVDLSSGEITLLGHLPLTLSNPFRAVWGSDGDVIIAGYHLMLVQD